MRCVAAITPLLMAAVASAAHVSVAVLPERTAVQPGETVTVAFEFKIDPDWHLYWMNPGDTGLPPAVKWTLPGGVTAGPLRFPTPGRIDADGVTAFGYHDTVTLLADLHVARDVRTPIEVKAAVRWVVCADACVAESTDIAFSLPVGSGEPRDAARFAVWRAQQPERSRVATPIVAVIDAIGKHGSIDLPVPAGKVGVDFFPPKSDSLVFEKPVTVDGRFRTAFRVLSGSPADADGVGLVVWKDVKSGKTSSVEMLITYRLSVPSTQE